MSDAPNQELLELKQKNLALSSELMDLEKLSAHVEFSLPKSKAALAEMSLSKEKLLLCDAKLAQAKQDLADSKENIKFLSSFVKVISRQVMAVGSLTKKGLFDSASDILNSLSAHANDLSAPWTAELKEQIEESIGYQRVKLVLLRGRHNEAQGLPPCGEAEIDALIDDIVELGMKYHAESERVDLLNEALAIKLNILAVREEATIHDMDSLEAIIAERDHYLSLTPTPDERVAEAKKKLYKVILEEFTELSFLYFDDEPNFDKALSVFHQKGSIEKEDIAHHAYKEAEDDKAFRIAFLCQMALRKDVSGYKDQVIVLSSKAEEGDEDSLDLLAHFLSMPLIDSTKFDLTVKSLKTLSFEQKIHFFAFAIKLGLDEEKQVLVFQFIEQLRIGARRGDLEKMAPDLAYLDLHIASSLKEDWAGMKGDLLRSPRAHKVVTKTQVDELRIFAGEDQNALGAPLGKKLKSAYVKSWDMLKYVLYWFFAIPLPLVLSGIAYYLMYYFKVADYIGSAIFALPFGLCLLFFAMVGLAFFGRDEKGSMGYRRALGFVAIVLLAGSAVIFALPKRLLYGAEIIALPALIDGVFAYVLSLIFFKERNRAFAYAQLALFLVALGVAVGFMVYVMMSGLTVS